MTCIHGGLRIASPGRALMGQLVLQCNGRRANRSIGGLFTLHEASIQVSEGVLIRCRTEGEMDGPESCTVAA